MTDQYGDWQIFNSPGECPVAKGTRVQIHLASETRHQAEQRPPYVTSTWAWDLGVDRPGRVIAYRVLEEPKPFEPDLAAVRLYVSNIAYHCSTSMGVTTAAIGYFEELADALGYDITKREAGK